VCGAGSQERAAHLRRMRSARRFAQLVDSDRGAAFATATRTRPGGSALTDNLALPG
jgi:hypothetical protein